MKLKTLCVPIMLCSLLLFPTEGYAQKRFSSLVGDVQVGEVQAGGALEVPFITWGGDVATFHANGGLKTKAGTLFGGDGLNLNLVPGDDFVKQVRRYLSGKSPFLRGTLRMLGQASEVIGSDKRTKAVVFLQLTWSAGDHMVSRSHVKRLDDLRGKKVALQTGGPHVGMLDDILRTATLDWKDITVVWAKELTGKSGPAALFRKDSSIDACLVISPDMIGLTGGLESRGTGAEGTIKNSHVLISTATMSQSIADVYACRKDFYDSNRALVNKFTAGYLKACEQIDAMKTKYDDGGESREYSSVLALARSIYGSEVLPNEEEAHGLISDCTFVHLPGNQKFFSEPGNPVGFEAKQRAALDLAVNQGYAGVRAGFFTADHDYDSLSRAGKLTRKSLPSATRPVGKGQRTVYSFTISFEPNQNEFNNQAYFPEFQRVVELASLFGNAVIAVRGHADPYQTLKDLVQAGLNKKVLSRRKEGGKWVYLHNGKPLDLGITRDVVQHIEKGDFDGTVPSPRRTMQAALNLSLSRAAKVRDAIIAFAGTKGLILNSEQLKPVGVGIREPVVPIPRNLEQARKNMRVEFSIVEVRAEATTFEEL